MEQMQFYEEVRNSHIPASIPAFNPPRPSSPPLPSRKAGLRYRFVLGWVEGLIAAVDVGPEVGGVGQRGRIACLRRVGRGVVGARVLRRLVLVRVEGVVVGSQVVGKWVGMGAAAPVGRADGVVESAAGRAVRMLVGKIERVVVVGRWVEGAVGRWVGADRLADEWLEVVVDRLAEGAAEGRLEVVAGNGGDGVERGKMDSGRMAADCVRLGRTPLAAVWHPDNAVAAVDSQGPRWLVAAPVARSSFFAAPPTSP